jgi:hypothetical protein
VPAQQKKDCHRECAAGFYRGAIIPEKEKNPSDNFVKGTEAVLFCEFCGKEFFNSHGCSSSK